MDALLSGEPVSSTDNPRLSSVRREVAPIIIDHSDAIAVVTMLLILNKMCLI